MDNGTHPANLAFIKAFSFSPNWHHWLSLLAPYHTVLLIVAVVMILSLVAWIISRLGQDDFPYVPADSLLTPAERAFFEVLQPALAPGYHLFAKIRLADIIVVRRGLPTKRWQAAFNRICSKHADFVACDPQTLRIVGVIELDDRSHQALRRQLRDQFMDTALAAAGIPILRVPVQRTYSATALRKQADAIFQSRLATIDDQL